MLVGAPKPAHRIIHLQDWHYVPREEFAPDVRQQVGRPVSDEDVDKLYRKHLLEVELVPACAPQSGPRATILAPSIATADRQKG